ncbi:MAG TPA: LysM peptidoglycan-binding domain-containing protein [Actinomycetota bacterium]|nr:LysM peptidoglycan-binding domain-containing protein [Actinomycetota bacterium]
MALRQEDLVGLDAVLYRFPTDRIAARQARRAMFARRRRTLGIATIAVAVGLLLAGGPEGTAAASRPGAAEVVTIGRGDTIWGLAERFAPPSVDPRAYADAVLQLNELEGPLQPGMRLKLP